MSDFGRIDGSGWAFKYREYSWIFKYPENIWRPYKGYGVIAPVEPSIAVESEFGSSLIITYTGSLPDNHDKHDFLALQEKAYTAISRKIEEIIMGLEEGLRVFEDGSRIQKYLLDENGDIVRQDDQGNRNYNELCKQLNKRQEEGDVRS